jgi:hypothetical protein
MRPYRTCRSNPDRSGLRSRPALRRSSGSRACRARGRAHSPNRLSKPPNRSDHVGAVWAEAALLSASPLHKYVPCRIRGLRSRLYESGRPDALLVNPAEWFDSQVRPLAWTRGRGLGIRKERSIAALVLLATQALAQRVVPLTRNSFETQEPGSGVRGRYCDSCLLAPSA